MQPEYTYICAYEFFVKWKKIFLNCFKQFVMILQRLYSEKELASIPNDEDDFFILSRFLIDQFVAFLIFQYPEQQSSPPTN